MNVRVRIGPSPTGDPHVGTAYIALFNYVFAKKHGGKFILRVEDTDQQRSKPQWESMLLSSLKWLGLEWDEGPDIGGPHAPYRQSERAAIYQEHAAKLLENGAAYQCFCTPGRLKKLREEQRARKQNPGYDGHCIGLSDAERAALLKEGTASVIRLKVNKAGKTSFYDKLRGEVVFENVQVDDQVLMKSDGLPTYHLANVVDDHLMGITHVMRAEEWITSTPKHVLLYAAFSWPLPEFIHMPLLRNKDKSKISKRKNPVSLNYYKEAGFLPEALKNYLGMMGWTMPDEREKFSVPEMIEHFTFDRMSLGGPVFDIQKLSWLNGLYLRESTPEAMVKNLRKNILSDERLLQVARLVHERVDKLEDFVDAVGFFFNGELAYDEAARKLMVPKTKSPKEMAHIFKILLERIDAMAAIERSDIEATLKALCQEESFKPKELFMPVRIAVTGRKATPGLWETMEVLGKERCRRRLRAVISLMGTLN